MLLFQLVVSLESATLPVVYLLTLLVWSGFYNMGFEFCPWLLLNVYKMMWSQLLTQTKIQQRTDFTSFP